MNTQGTLAAALMVLLSACGQDSGAGLASEVVIEADSIPASLTGEAGSMAAGAAEFVSREGGHCVLCHAIEGLEAEFQGNVGPDLTGVGERLTPGQIRLRIVDAQRIWPDTVMPAYYRTGGLRQVGQEFDGRPALTAGQIEDLVAYLSSQGS
ncbi:putative sulfur oxidation cytochrome SoxX [Hyphomonas neptunium ATCC 15444]|uniref:Putative sulfur oxidation cytochrome SoxX n=2 Tax=Hyphomonas TaxID=85 RepID=Q0BZB9_HYPNA|nr:MULTISPECIES: sulfur oxidation c-type cytochrome SoxX [Hyphomonas]ABI78510.1 putative sulfur oxidation cytochrome SoxX [Hyphomonas neptunium ATCC 15444]KCZ95263.1 putative sulfur oxidation cytochrome SoxX [Hyphomonas hirschiana VP5]